MAASAAESTKADTSLSESAAAADTPTTAAEAVDVPEKLQADTIAAGKPTSAAKVPTACIATMSRLQMYRAAAEARFVAQASVRTQAAATGQAAVPEPSAAVPAAVLAGQVCREANIRAVLY